MIYERQGHLELNLTNSTFKVQKKEFCFLYEWSKFFVDYKLLSKKDLNFICTVKY